LDLNFYVKPIGYSGFILIFTASVPSESDIP